ncbi:hypothetical protein TBLA_0B09360 [Henningerozyma blattae CBS 6284]|uniref:DNA mismatch repair protein S5 domain-containing protein n=1 Tax=Henningerozyma blattae (strain ATCC 34711 / CBS 6284 / DSM 70876 / NBRC 10599 / NRRL Y-10934 / UCD 77-7) TaxID=1071380 RepID=I2H051_HENB6|nr:hypothetical protein TBLA_0B09360 [Tetrapisispora blattae CBS 6284]CCH59753.1 hypothetical protein TBLA_0B09360 [Tetrapisispora blattae CBS 6284]
MSAPKIKPLDPDVINKIAAGEIIVSPVNALKEMLENSIDAASKNIEILVKDGGTKLLQITDDGHGISKEDLSILCERFTTSKLKNFDDLSSIETYGFRGEALASISHIAKVSVITKTADDRCAWKTTYLQGKMTSDPIPTAGKDGTTISVQDLFYNVPSRLRTLKSSNEEFSKIVDVAGRYAIHSKNIGISVKKLGTSQCTLNIRNNLTTKDRIRSIFGHTVASNIFHIDFPTSNSITNPDDKETSNSDTDEKNLGLKSITGEFNSLNYVSKKAISPIFFINNRLITCDPLRRSLTQVYSGFLPKGNKHFIYLSLVIDPRNVDVNIHPTKREVRFLYQDEIIEKISLYLNGQLSKMDSSRSFATPSLKQESLSSQNFDTTASSSSKRLLQSQITSSSLPIGGVAKPKRYENKLVRTDSAQTKITSFLRNSRFTPTIAGGEQFTKLDSNDNTDTLTTSTRNIRSSSPSIMTSNTTLFVEDEEDDIKTKNNSYSVVPKERVNVNLTSIKQLRENVDASTHQELTNIFANLTYVGIIDQERRLAAIQHDLKLFLVDYAALTNELFYQIGLTDFANFGIFELTNSVNDEIKSEDNHIYLIELLKFFKDTPIEKKVKIISQLWMMREMLDEYFSIRIGCTIPDFEEEEEEDKDFPFESIYIKSVPLLLKGYIPPLSKLPFFIYRLGTRVVWDEESNCLDGILKQIALLYIPEVIEKKDPEDPNTSEADKIQYISKTGEMASVLEHTIFPCVKRRFLAPTTLLKDVVEIANLPGLYKVFERC